MGTDILSKIVAHKKEEVAAAQRRKPENLLREEALKPRKRRPFLKALAGPPGPSGVNIIAEIKRASPSKGIIRQNLNPAAYASAYEKGGAAALSVLIDQPYFQGSAEDLQTARKATALPVLRKDFLISAYQIYESSVLGADAVLLITRILSKEQLRDYLALCKELHLDALVETHSETEIEAAAWAGARLIGINNRNLRSFETSIETTIRMASFLEPHHIAVAESGIKGREDIEKILKAGVWNFLIGETLVRAGDPVACLKSLRGDKQ